MQYFGGKSRIAKKLVSFLESERKENQIFVDMFTGGINIVSKMSGLREAYDNHEPLIRLYQELQNGFLLPDSITESEYLDIKLNRNNDKYPKALTGFVGFGCAFAGKYFKGYARNTRRDNYCLAAKKSVLKKIQKCPKETVLFELYDYRNKDFENKLIYCDPPYENTIGYTRGLNKIGTEQFNTDEFWEWVRKQSQKNKVFVSEYNAPDDFECVLAIETKTEMRTKLNGRENRIEKLFKLK